MATERTGGERCLLQDQLVVRSTRYSRNRATYRYGTVRIMVYHMVRSQFDVCLSLLSALVDEARSRLHVHVLHVRVTFMHLV